MPPRPEKSSKSAEDRSSAALPNALKRPTQKGFAREVKDKAPEPVTLTKEALDEFQEMRGAYTASDLATGRGLTYEWEFFYAALAGRVSSLEGGGGGGGGGGGPGLSYVHTQSAAAATWTITHALNTKPGVTIVANDGHELMAEVIYPDDNTTVIVHGAPYAGKAYLRG